MNAIFFHEGRLGEQNRAFLDADFTKIDRLAELLALAPAFSTDFVRYFEYRESTVFDEEKKRLKDDECELRKVKQAEADLKWMLQKASSRSQEHSRSVKQRSAFEQRFTRLCAKLNVLFEEEEVKMEKKVARPYSTFQLYGNRAPGKRAIKSTVKDPEELLFCDDEEDESDEDFVHHSDNEEEEDASSTAMDEEETGTSIEDKESLADEESVMDTKPSDGVPEPLMCSVCLNTRNIEDDRVIQCDRCSVAVHETCYAVEDVDNEAASVASNYSTEPWFCEVCLFNLTKPPHCELCPVRFGAFKRSDVGGKWVHLLCALYTPGITFGDVHGLSGISWQEVDYKRFGRKACDGCSNVLEARTGITTGCEAGLCKHHYHISCAQRLGLLVDADAEKLDEIGNKHVDPHFILCRHHNVSDVVSKKRNNYAIFMRQEQKRMILLNRRLLNDRESSKLSDQRKRYDERLKGLQGVTIHLPAAFSEKAELIGITNEEFTDSFLRFPPTQIPFLAPAFSTDFVRYFEYRESTVFDEEKKRLKDDECELRKVKQAEADLKWMLQKASSRSQEHSRSVKQRSAFEQRFTRLCAKLNVLFEEEEVKMEKKVARPYSTFRLYGALESILLGRASMLTASRIYGVPFVDLDQALMHSRRSQNEVDILRNAARLDLFVFEWTKECALPDGLNLQTLLDLWNRSDEKRTGINPLTRLANVMDPNVARFPLILYKRILRLHYGLPPEMRLMGDSYVKSEFKLHAKAPPEQALVFLKEWTLSKQLSNRGIARGASLGADFRPEYLDRFSDDQIRQLYELKVESEKWKNRTKEVDE
ncbi:Phf-14 [Aphelenchoides besseyi]|nr:Phf-14 [Aphelenchoides besseyi]